MKQRLSERYGVLRVATVLVVVFGLLSACGGPLGDGADLEPLDAFAAVIKATEVYPLVALGEYHQMQEWHDFMQALLMRREFTNNVDDLVVEFGNALYQDVADRYILDLEPLAFPELAQIWRNTIGGGVLWDAPVYEEFFRTVREVNELLPPDQRVRVLLGDPRVDLRKVQETTDTAELENVMDRDAFFADVVEREVLAKERHAVLIAGADHLRSEVHANTGPEYPNVATLLAREHPGALVIVYPLPFEYAQTVGQAVEETLDPWSAPSLAYLDGTWLGAQPVPHRAFDPDSIFEEQVDAVIWFGPKTSLTLSRADPAIYESGAYASELRRRSEILSEFYGESINYIAEGLRLATARPRLFETSP
jgi:hypothetical protein